LVFLDVRHDRYFCLGDELEPVFQVLLAAGGEGVVGVERLVSAGVIDSGKGAPSPIAQSDIPSPSVSLLDLQLPARPHSARTVAEVAWRLCRAKMDLKRRTLRTNLDAVRVRRRPAVKDIMYQARVISLAAAFNQARRSVPLAPRCLPDALALLDFLGSRQVFPDLVFGVRLNPFGAHCWVQSGDMVLNDRADHTWLHTQILAV
jgi:hypothetical protein